MLVTERAVGKVRPWASFSNPSLIVERPPFMLSESGWGEFEIHTFPLFPHVVVFQLHPSFSNPTRIVERPPFMLSESGWGEFEIAMTIVFHADASEMPAELTHHLRLYPEGSAPNQPLSTKRPVVAEQYDELVFCEPQIAFFHRIRSNPMVRIHGSEEAITAAGNHTAIPQDGSSSAPADARNLESDLRGENRGDTLDHPLSQWFLQFSDEQELTAIAAARKQVILSSDVSAILEMLKGYLPRAAAMKQLGVKCTDFGDSSAVTLLPH
ncbi:unnamed protein product [Closterium sp. Naga37s-1]|nr:unnamed protein product [Closterium sp. Naga37s-1]